MNKKKKYVAQPLNNVDTLKTIISKVATNNAYIMDI